MSDPNPDPNVEDGRGVAFGADLIIPVLAAAFTIYFIASSSDLVWEARANGTVIGVVLLALIAVELFRIVMEWRAGGGTFRLGEIATWDEAQRKRLLLLLILCVFIGTIDWVGTTLGLFLTMVASMWVLGVRSIRSLVLIALATALTFYVLFIAILEARFPAGPVEHLLAPLLHMVG